MKKTIIFILTVLTALTLGQTLIYARLIDSMAFTNPQEGRVAVEGSLPGFKNNRYFSIFIIDSDKSIADIDGSNDEIILYANGGVVPYDGVYSHEFIFAAAKNEYKLVVRCGEDMEEKIFSYDTQEGLKTDVFDKIKNGQFTDSEIYTQLAKYEVVIGIDLSFITEDRDKNIFVKRVKESGNDIANAIVGVTAGVKDEIALLDSIKAAENWSQIQSLMKTAEGYNWIDLSKYNRVDNKSALCARLMGVTFADYDSLGVQVNLLADEYIAAQSNTGSGISGGGGGGRSNSGVSTVVAYDSETPIANPSIEPTASFTDIGDFEWAATAIEVLVDRGVINGVGDKLFNPGGNIKREELVKMCVLAFGLLDDEAVNDFADVEDDAWYSPYVSSAKQSGIIEGVGDQIFGVGQDITRQDLAVILHRCWTLFFAGGKASAIGDAAFDDFDSIAEYAREAVSFFAENKIINGVGDNRFAPANAATRAEAAKIIFGIIEVN